MEDFAALLPWTDYLFLNQEEAGMLAGTEDPDEAARRFRDRGAGCVIVKMGALGCSVSSAESTFRQRAFQVEVLDTTGAGDCFAGAFLASLQRGLALEECARTACAYGALSVGALGSIAGLVDWERLQAMLHEGILRPSRND
jgi:sugar/nucleoside kinase (ribokinase family)